jgi:hypothetical protein
MCHGDIDAGVRGMNVANKATQRMDRSIVGFSTAINMHQMMPLSASLVSCTTNGISYCLHDG